VDHDRLRVRLTPLHLAQEARAAHEDGAIAGHGDREVGGAAGGLGRIVEEDAGQVLVGSEALRLDRGAERAAGGVGELVEQLLAPRPRELARSTVDRSRDSEALVATYESRFSRGGSALSRGNPGATIRGHAAGRWNPGHADPFRCLRSRPFGPPASAERRAAWAQAQGLRALGATRGASAAVSKQQIRDRLWPDTFVSDSTLSSLAAQVRRALGGDGPPPIRTVHGFGYAFEAEGHEEPPRGGTGLVGAHLFWNRRTIPLVEGENVIGRDPDVTVQIDAAGVSRRHARILPEHGRFTLEDLGSKNGTYLGEARLERCAELKDGDELRLGQTLVVFRIRNQVAPTATEPSRRT